MEENKYGYGDSSENLTIFSGVRNKCFALQTFFLCIWCSTELCQTLYWLSCLVSMVRIPFPSFVGGEVYMSQTLKNPGLRSNDLFIYL